MPDTKQLVSDFLLAANINFSAKYVCQTKRDKWDCDEWRVSIGAMDTDFFTGLGHRKPVKGSLHIEGSKYPKNSIGYKQWCDIYVKPVSPCAADVLYSLLMDSDAADQSFNDWCANYGFDNDSISAFNTYQSCCTIAEKMRKVFTRSQIEQLREMLQDY